MFSQMKEGGVGEILFLSPPLSSSVTSALSLGRGVRLWRGAAEHSFLPCALLSAASHRSRHHSQVTEHVSVLRSERPSGFLNAGA